MKTSKETLKLLIAAALLLASFWAIMSGLESEFFTPSARLKVSVGALSMAICWGWLQSLIKTKDEDERKD